MVDDEIVPGNFQDATIQLLNMKQKGADYAYINVTTTGVSLVLKGAKALGLTTKFVLQPVGLHRGSSRWWPTTPPRASTAWPRTSPTAPTCRA